MAARTQYMIRFEIIIYLMTVIRYLLFIIVDQNRF